jgi:hydroxymethylpyrimidine kinase/phosphomethylpyrimidine kinase/thiamine-phosphate diphosphorylase
MGGGDAQKRPVMWAVAGLDSGGGAGLSADERAGRAWGVHVCPVAAALTAQNSMAVSAVQAVNPSFLRAQLEALRSDMPAQAVKLGLLGSVANAQVVMDVLQELDQDCLARSGSSMSPVPLVVDPVFKATTGAFFASQELIDFYRYVLIPRAQVITPNHAEAALLLGCRIEELDHPAACGQAIQTLSSWGCPTVILTGGDSDLASDTSQGVCQDVCQDWVMTPQASGVLAGRRIQTPHHHGTGCAFASSMASALAQGLVAADAVVRSKMLVSHALQAAYAVGQGAGPVNPQAGFAQQASCMPQGFLYADWGHHGAAPVSSSVKSRPSFRALGSEALGVYPVMPNSDWVARVLQAGSGVRVVQLRLKEETLEGRGFTLKEEIQRSMALARAHQALLFVNDHWELALELGADGVHLGQGDLPHADLPALARAGLYLGVSTHSDWELATALACQPSYIAYGPVFATTSKVMPWQAQGLNQLQERCQLLGDLGYPVVAIGGMDVARTEQAARAGASGVALISAVTQAVDPVQVLQTLQALQAAFERGRAGVQKSN